MTPDRMEEIFTDRLADLIVRLLDYRHEQKLKALAGGKIKVNDEKNEKETEPKI